MRAPSSSLAVSCKEKPKVDGQKFVGRTGELSELRDEWELAAAGSLRCVLLSGEPGVGKTRLADEAVARLPGPVTFLEARARRLGATASFGLWVDALERHLRTLPREEISALCGGSVDDLASLLRSVAEVRGRAPEFEPPRPRLLGSLGGLLADLARPHPVALVLNDVHLADPSSWEALSHLADQFSDAPILVLATARGGELAEAPTALRTILDLEEMGVLSRIELGPLDDHALTELAEDVMGSSVGKEFLDWLWDRSRGNPLYAGGLLRAARDEGIGPFSGGLHHLPEELTARVLLRVEQLDPDARAVLEILAVAGGPVELAHLVRFTDWSLDTLAPVLDGLVRLRLVTEAERGHIPAYEISHPLIQETLYEQIGGARRFAVHRRVARNLLVMGRLGEAAGHFARSCETGDAEAITVLVDALGQAEQRGAYQEGLGILGILVDLVPSGDRRWEQVGAALSPAADWVVDHRADADALRAVAALREVDAVLISNPDVVRRAAVKSRLTSFLSWGTGELAAAAVAAEEAVHLHRQADQHTQARLAALELAYAKGLAGNIPALHVGAETVLREAQSAGDTTAELFALGVRGTTAFYQGHFAQADADLRRSIAMAKQYAKPYRVTWGLMCLAWSLGYEGRIAEAYQTFEAAKATPGWRESNVLEMESLIRWLAGDYPGSMQCSREVGMLNASRIGLRRAPGPICLVLSGAELGELAEARRGLALARETLGSQVWFMGTGLMRHAEGILAWRDGHLPEAQLHLERAAAELISIGAPVIAGTVLVDLAELAHEKDAPDVALAAAARLETIAAPVDRPLYWGMAELGRAWASLASTRPSTAADAAQAALKHLALVDFPMLTARAELALGLAREGRDPELSVACLGEAAERFDCNGAVWRRDRVLNRLKGMGRAGRRAAGATMGARGLTSRELEIARLAAQRLRATDIAARLSISRRTVEAHLASVYAKVGVNSRRELADRIDDLAG
jgi:DNA-binding NarL/FixJ family response regulator